MRATFDDIPRLAGDCTTAFWQYLPGRPVVPTAVFGAPQLRMVSTGRRPRAGLSSTVAPCAGCRSRRWTWERFYRSRIQSRQVAGDLLFVDLTMGAFHACALTANRSAYCWGNNFRGYLGRGDRIHSAVPVAVAGGLSFATLAAGGAHVCAITTSGEVWCWGSSDYGQLGRDRSEGDAYVPIRVTLPIP